MSHRNQKNLVQTCKYLFFASTVQILSGCASAPSNMEATLANLKDPQTLVGKYFEAAAGQTLLGALQSDRFEGTMSLVKANPAQGKKDLEDRLAEGAFININEGLNPEQDKAKLILEILETKQYEGSKDLFFKVRLFNKKYMDTEWWVYSTDFGKISNPTNSPVRDEAPAKTRDKTNSKEASQKPLDKNDKDVHEKSVNKTTGEDIHEKSVDKTSSEALHDKSSDRKSSGKK